MKKLKVILFVGGVVLVGAVAKMVFFPGSDPAQGDEAPKAVSATLRAGVDAKAKNRPHARKKQVAAVRESAKRERPTFAIGQSEEAALNDLQRKLLEEIRVALREDDYKTLMRLVRKMQTSDEWPDGIPDSIKKAALEALGWYGSKCLPEIVPFLGDSNPEIVAEAVSQWEDAIAECESDREVSAQVKLAACVVTEAESVESILMEVMNMRHSVAVETFKDILKNGNEQAQAKVLEQIGDYTEDSTITTAEQLDEWLERNPDDPGDEEMYGSISDDADDD